MVVAVAGMVAAVAGGDGGSGGGWGWRQRRCRGRLCTCAWWGADCRRGSGGGRELYLDLQKH